MTSRVKIEELMVPAVRWLKSRQGPDGGYGNWNIGSTALATLALTACGTRRDDLAVARAVDCILHNRPRNSTFFRALGILALACTGGGGDRVRADAAWLVLSQRKTGGWGRRSCRETTNVAATFLALQALYAAELKGFSVPRGTWERAAGWYRRKLKFLEDGGFSGSAANGTDYRYPAASALAGLKIIALFSSHPSKVRELADKAAFWLAENNITEPGAAGGDRYYFYLYSLAQGGRLAPYQPYLKEYDWQRDVIKSLAACRSGEGYWGTGGDVVSTSLALLVLAGFSVATPVVLTYTGPQEGQPGRRVVLSAELRDREGRPLPGQTLYFICPPCNLYSAAAITNERGVAELKAVPAGPPDKHEVRVILRGSREYAGAMDRKPFKVQRPGKKFFLAPAGQMLRLGGHTIFNSP